MAKRKMVSGIEVIDAPAVVTDQDEAMAAQVGAGVVAFLGQVRVFFARARELEGEAAVTLTQAKALALPTNGAEDVQVQSFIKAANAAKKEIQAHWTITSAVSQLHRHLTGRRDVGVKYLEEAAAFANKLHNDYNEQALRRAAEEEDRRRREAEAQELSRRRDEAAKAEAAAEALEEASGDLSERERSFVAQVIAGQTGRNAALVAGFKDPMKSAARLLTLPKIQAAIKAQKEAAEIRRQANARKAEPLVVQVEEVKADVQKASGATDRTTWRAEVLDPAALLEAFRAGTHGIPADLFSVNQVVANSYARALGVQMNRWPGIRATSTTKVV